MWQKKFKNTDQIAIQKLDRATFTRPDDNTQSATVTKEGHEAPSYFKRGKFYYLTYGELCCFCRRGSTAKVHVSLNPFGPFQFVQQLNRRWRNPMHVPAQNSDVIEIRLASGKIEYLWAADLWFSAKSGLKGDDHQYWEPLKFIPKVVTFASGTSVRVPVPTRSTRHGQWVDCFTLELALPNTLVQGGDLNPCRSGRVLDGGEIKMAVDVHDVDDDL
jgi:hypothetical protein